MHLSLDEVIVKLEEEDESKGKVCESSQGIWI